SFHFLEPPQTLVWLTAQPQASHAVVIAFEQVGLRCNILMAQLPVRQLRALRFVIFVTSTSFFR
ncbi:MAG: hypothetical protein ACJ8KA_06575, partial [Sulfurifustis sp.]